MKQEVNLESSSNEFLLYSNDSALKSYGPSKQPEPMRGNAQQYAATPFESVEHSEVNRTHYHLTQKMSAQQIPQIISHEEDGIRESQSSFQDVLPEQADANGRALNYFQKYRQVIVIKERMKWLREDPSQIFTSKTSSARKYLKSLKLKQRQEPKLEATSEQLKAPTLQQGREVKTLKEKAMKMA